jgi:hypothetical protein
MQYQLMITQYLLEWNTPSVPLIPFTKLLGEHAVLVALE